MRLPIEESLELIIFAESSLTKRVISAVDWSKKNQSAQKFLHVKLISSKDKAAIIVEGKTVHLFLHIAEISLAVARFFKSLVRMRIVVCM